ncbi:FKBP-type peptidyl-prolyl cis-trans isomerase [Flavobacteriales bacterium]|nr:FKBP-type peptidyl-prolyl cis-trans isomerase [Flavobacteriales bacterium]
MKIKNLLAISGIVIISSCVVSKKKYEAVETEKAALIEASKPTTDLTNEETKVGYSLGLNIAKSLKGEGLESIDTAAFAQALGDVFSGRTALVTEKEAQDFLQAYFQKLQNEAVAKQTEAGGKFLAMNSLKADVVSLPSGLQYKVIKEGNGAIPKATDKVKTHYKGTLIDGTKFDSSYDRGKPAVFGVTRVIPGWVEALQIMPVGSKWELYIPHYLAYGERGQGTIPPYATLVFELELLAIEQ